MYMYVCMCLCICACMYVFTFSVLIHASNTYTHTHMYTYIFVPVPNLYGVITCSYDSFSIRRPHAVAHCPVVAFQHQRASVCIHVWIYSHELYISVHYCIYAYMCVCVFMRVGVSILRMFVCRHVCVYLYTDHTHARLCQCVYVYTCIFTLVSMHIKHEVMST